MARHSEILSKFNSLREVYEGLVELGYKLRPATVYSWNIRGIPSDWWPRIIEVGKNVSPKVKIKLEDFFEVKQTSPTRTKETEKKIMKPIEGEVWKVRHQRKGNFTILINKIGPEWVDGVITDGTAIMFSQSNRLGGAGDTGEAITLRLSLTKFMEKLRPDTSLERSCENCKFAEGVIGCTVGDSNDCVGVSLWEPIETSDKGDSENG